MNRKENKEYLIPKIKGEFMEDLCNRIEEYLDFSYINGYNTALIAAEKVLSEEDYMKIVKKLEEEE
jgi:hypothetical protein